MPLQRLPVSLLKIHQIVGEGQIGSPVQEIWIFAWIIQLSKYTGNVMAAVMRESSQAGRDCFGMFQNTRRDGADISFG
jgi:hypothetical protein